MKPCREDEASDSFYRSQRASGIKLGTHAAPDDQKQSTLKFEVGQNL